MKKVILPQGYKPVACQLVGADGNAFSIIGRVCRAILDAGYDKAVAKVFMDQATSADYVHLLYIAQIWSHEPDEDYDFDNICVALNADDTEDEAEEEELDITKQA